VYDLNNDMDAIVRRHAISQAAIEANHTALLEIISSPDLDREEKYRRCIEAIMPSCNNNPEDANKYYNYHMLQGITAERIAILAEKKIAGIDTYEAAGISGDAADKQRAEDLTMNAKNLENILAAYGVGRLQAKQVIRRFDTATEEAIAEFTGVSHGAYPSV
jgi:hypothetical protein